MKTNCYLAIGFFLITSATNSFASWVHHDFDAGMQYDRYNKDQIAHITKQIVGIDEQDLHSFFKKRYEQLNPSVIAPDKETRIPKIIHQIWLGSPVPQEFEPFMKSWVKNHIGGEWRYVLWTDKEIAALNLYNQAFYNEATNYGMKSDIARFEILYRFGGVYVDMDTESLNSLDILHHTYDFYIGAQPLDSGFLQLGIGILGAIPSHPVIGHCIAGIKNNWNCHKGAPQKTGPVHTTRMVFAYSNPNSGLRDIVFPAIYFYPLGAQEVSSDYKKWIRQGSFSVHWWAKSWMPKNYRKTMFRSIQNEASTVTWND